MHKSTKELTMHEVGQGTSNVGNKLVLNKCSCDENIKRKIKVEHQYCWARER